MFKVGLHFQTYRQTVTISLPFVPFPDLVLMDFEGLKARARVLQVSYVGDLNVFVCTAEYY